LSSKEAGTARVYRNCGLIRKNHIMENAVDKDLAASYDFFSQWVVQKRWVRSRYADIRILLRGLQYDI